MDDEDSSNQVAKRLEMWYLPGGGLTSRAELEARILGKGLPPKDQSTRPPEIKNFLKELNRRYNRH